MSIIARIDISQLQGFARHEGVRLSERLDYANIALHGVNFKNR